MKRLLTLVMIALLVGALAVTPLCAAAESVETAQTNESTTHITEVEMLESFDWYLSEVLSFSQAERQKASIDAAFLENEQIWQVKVAIHAEDIGAETADLMAFYPDAYDPNADTYTLYVYFLPDGSPLGVESLMSYVVRTLIPSTAYPGNGTEGSDYQRFLVASVEEKAAFTEKWKPVVDAWLTEHPEAVAWLETDSGIYDDIVCTRNVYGVPSTDSIPQEEAIQLAKEAYLHSGIAGVTDEMIQERCTVYSFYDISAPTLPLWKIEISYSAVEQPVQEEPKGGYRVIMDALTGQVLDANSHEGSCCKNVFEWAAEFL